jgi:penicillin-binding protein 1A
MAAQIQPRRGDAGAPKPIGMWLVPSHQRPHVLRKMLQFIVLPPLLAMALVAFGLTVGKTFGTPTAKLVHSYTDLKVPKEPRLPQTTYLYDRHGRLITTLHAEVNRTEVPLKDISQHLQDAVIAVEDRDFYQHGGIDPRALLRAAIADVQSGEFVQGGSTITQQYVKLVFTGSERTLSRKLKEAILAQKLDHMYTKRQILEKYLNLVYFGHGAYGAEAAAETYFGIPAAKLSVVQSALLAGLIQAPSDYDPARHSARAKGRRDLVLSKMAEQGYITQDVATRLAQKRVKIRKDGKAPVPAAYFVSYVSRFLQHEVGQKETFTGGLQVTTTLDWDMQQAAERAVERHLPKKTDPSAALVALDPRNGDILAMVGGRDFTQAKFNLATQAHRQTGSAFKVFTYAEAMRQHMDPHAFMSGPPNLTIPDQRCFDPTGNKPWEVSNYADEAAGTMSLQDSLAHSVNTIFAQLVVDVGPDNVADLAHKMGIRSRLQDVCSITLGSQSVTPLDMATAYATLASRGVRHWPDAVRDAATPDGKVLVKDTATGKRVMDGNDADLVTLAMQGVIQKGTGTAANIGRPAAGKTGTAQNFQDAWFCGFVPQLSACVWVGYPKTEDRSMRNVEGFPEVFGGSIPAMIWHDFMASALKGTKVLGFNAPSFTGYDKQPARAIPLPFLPAPSPSPSPIPTPPGHQCKKPPCKP